MDDVNKKALHTDDKDINKLIDNLGKGSERELKERKMILKKALDVSKRIRELTEKPL